MQYLILGANGYIGSYLYRRMKEDNIKAVGTCHAKAEKSDLICYDIRNDSLDIVMGEITGEEKAAIVCIAESNIDRCYEEYERAYQVNVVLMKDMIHKLVQNGFKVIFFSSDNVYDGKNGNYTEESETSPINEYGKMKAEMEQYLQDNVREVCIFRISKVLSTGKEKQNLLSEWDEKIREGKIFCLRDNIISFVHIEDIYQACRIASESNLHGLYNIVGNEAYSRKQLAEKFYKLLGVSNIQIIECNANELPFKDFRRPGNVSMNNGKFIRETGYVFASMNEVISGYLDSQRCM